MKVLFLTTSFPRTKEDVSGTFVFRIAKSLVESGWSVKVLAPGAQEAARDEALDGVAVERFTYMWPRRGQLLAYGYGIPHNIRRRPLLSLLLLPFLVSWFIAALRSAKHCEIVHAHWITSALVGLPVARLRRKPLVVTMWGTDMRSLPSFLARWLLTRADGVIGFGAEAQAYTTSLGIESTSVPAPVDETRFNKTVSPTEFRAELGLDRDQSVITFIGRLAREKDPLTFVRSCILIHDALPTVHFIIAGDGPLNDAVAAAVKRSSASGVIHLLGPRSDIPAILAASTVFVSTSPLENVWSATIVEAAFMGVACVLTDVGHTREVFEDNTQALLYPADSAVDLAEKVLTLLQQPELRAKLANSNLDLHEAHGFRSLAAAQAHTEVYRAATLRGQLRKK